MQRAPPSRSVTPQQGPGGGGRRRRPSGEPPPSASQPRRERQGLGRPGRRPGRDRRPGPGLAGTVLWLRSVERRCAPRHRLDPHRLADHADGGRQYGPYLPVDGRDPAGGHAGRPGGVAALAAPGRLPRQRRCGRAGRLPARPAGHLATADGRQDHRELGGLSFRRRRWPRWRSRWWAWPMRCCRPASPVMGQVGGRHAPAPRVCPMYLAVDHPTDLLSGSSWAWGSRWSPSASLPPMRSTR